MPDARLQALAAIVKPERIVPAIVEFVDIAGLVAGASKGEGLGNQFLAHIRETDAIVNVVRCFEDENVIHVAGKVDPIADIEVIQTELRLADLATRREAASTARRRSARSGRQGSGQARRHARKAAAPRSTRRKPVRSLDFSEGRAAAGQAAVPDHGQAGDVRRQRDGQRLREQPAPGRGARATPQAEGAPVVAICAKTEAEIADIDDADKQEFLAEMGMTEPGLDRVIRAGYTLLGLQTYFTAGVKEVRAWTIHIGDTAPQAAGVIHTDFERGLHPRADHRLRRLRRVQGRARREGSREDAGGRQGIRRQGRRRDELPVQRLNAFYFSTTYRDFPQRSEISPEARR